MKFLFLPVAQMAKNLPAMQETRIRSLGQEDPLEKGNGNPLQQSRLENPINREAWQATVLGVAESDTIEQLTHICLHDKSQIHFLFTPHKQCISSRLCHLSSIMQHLNQVISSPEFSIFSSHQKKSHQILVKGYKSNTFPHLLVQKPHK